MEYSEEILDHARHPRNFGELSGVTHQAKGSNASCGDMVEFYLRVKSGKVEKAGFRGVGCALSTAMASMLTEEVVGKEVAELQAMDIKVAKKLMGEVNPGRVKCVLVAIEAVKMAAEGSLS